MSRELVTQWRVNPKRVADETHVRRPGVLIADDVNLILVILKLELEPRGFRVWLAQDGDEAVEVYERDHDDIDIVLLDVRMPRRGGPRTLKDLRQVDPEFLACFMTGDPGDYSSEELLGCGVIATFEKPFSSELVASYLQRLISPLDRLDFPDKPEYVARHFH